MSNQQGNPSLKIYQCWISEKDKILSFRYVEGYELKAFDTYTEFQVYCYRKSELGYRVQ